MYCLNQSCVHIDGQIFMCHENESTLTDLKKIALTPVSFALVLFYFENVYVTPEPWRRSGALQAANKYFSLPLFLDVQILRRNVMPYLSLSLQQKQIHSLFIYLANQPTCDTVVEQSDGANMDARLKSGCVNSRCLLKLNREKSGALKLFLHLCGR